MTIDKDEQQKGLAFRIDGIHPDTISFKRLNAYLKEIANYLGSEKELHLVGLHKKCIHLALSTDSPEASLEIQQRVRKPTGTTLDSHQRILKLLSEDNAVAQVLDGDRKVVHIDGRRYEQNTPERLPRGFVTFRGELIKIGGVDDSVPFEMIEYATGQRIKGNAGKVLAQKMAARLFTFISVTGIAGWERQVGSQPWKLDKFVASDFEELSKSPAVETIETLFRLSDPDAPDAIERLKDLRSDN